MNVPDTIFKSYDIRGIYPTELDDSIAYAVGRAFAKYLDNPHQVVVAKDGRVSSDSLEEQVIKGLTDVGVNVISVGQASSDMFYFACATKSLPGIAVTASHNPKEYNGFKMVKQIPHLLSGEEGIAQMKQYILADDLGQDAQIKGTVSTWDVMPTFIKKITSVVNPDSFKALTIHADTANGMVGPILKQLESKLPSITVIPMYWDVDGTFPNHGGDPLDAKNREDIVKRVTSEASDLGIMFDPDGDRFFAVDATGRFISGDFMTAILAEYFLQIYPNANIVYDIRASQVVKEVIEKNGGTALANRVGHTHIKKRMLKESAVFGGEVSGHYYFKDFYLCDSGVLTMLFLLDYLSKKQIRLENIIDKMEKNYHISGEINSTVGDVTNTISRILKEYEQEAVEPVNTMDGITLEFDTWRFNLRGSNTQPLIRLNLEADSQEQMQQKRDELLKKIRQSK